MKTALTVMQGTGKDFVVLDGIRHDLLDKRLGVSTRAGDLTISREGADNPVWMTGPAATVFDGELEIDES
ncbi:MAG: hypothetical protein IH606_08375 [Burkholderiales bacterium]|nr:hypothetical protein [Burkholderiales bacterium]